MSQGDHSVPPISVIVPLYNKAACVERFVRSVQAQTQTDFEVVIVDDGSTDASHAVAVRAVGDDSRFRVIRQRNGGVSRARNAAMRAARAPWVAFIDADDEWLPGFLEAILEAARRYPEAIMISTAHRTQFDTGGESDNLGMAGAQLYHFGYDLFEAWQRRRDCPVFIGATAVRREVMAAIGGFTEGMNLGEELLAFIRIREQGPMLFVNRVLATYHLSATGSLATSPSPTAIRSHLQLVDELERQVRKGSCPPSVRNIHRDIHAHHLTRAGMGGELWGYLWRTPGYWPLRVWVLAMLEWLGVRGRLRRMLRANDRTEQPV